MNARALYLPLPVTPDRWEVYRRWIDRQARLRRTRIEERVARRSILVIASEPLTTTDEPERAA